MDVSKFNILGEEIDIKDTIARESWLRNKKIVVYGDSTTQINNSYIKKLSSYGAIITNRGVSGTGIVHDNNNHGMIDLIPYATDLDNFDYIFMCYGTNDIGGWYDSYPGTIGLEKSSNYIGYILDTVFSYLQSKKCHPVFILPAIIHNDEWNSFQTNSYTGSSQDFYNDTVISYCEKYHIEYFNLFTLCPVNNSNYQNYYMNESNGYWIHPNDRLNTIIFNHIISRHSNNGRCYPDVWEDVSNLFSSSTKKFLYSQNIANTRQELLNDVTFFKQSSATSLFTVNSNGKGKTRIRLSGIFTASESNFDKIQLALYSKNTDTYERVSLFSRQKTMTSVVLELDNGSYAFQLYNTGGVQHMAIIGLKLEVQNGYLKPYDYKISPVSGKLDRIDLILHFLKSGLELVSTKGALTTSSGNIVSGDIIGICDTYFDMDIGTMFTMNFGNEMRLMSFNKNSIKAQSTIENPSKLIPLVKHFNYTNPFEYDV